MEFCTETPLLGIGSVVKEGRDGSAGKLGNAGTLSIATEAVGCCEGVSEFVGIALADSVEEMEVPPALLGVEVAVAPTLLGVGAGDIEVLGIAFLEEDIPGDVVAEILAFVSLVL